MNSKQAARLLLKVPYLIMPGPIAPLRVINDLALRGGYDAGMSGSVKWKPFELAEPDYAEVVAELRLKVQGLVQIDVPLEVKTFEDWCDWKVIRKVGEKGAELSALLTLNRELNKQLAMLKRGENDDEIERLQFQLVEIAPEISEIILSSRNK